MSFYIETYVTGTDQTCLLIAEICLDRAYMYVGKIKNR